MILFPCFSRRKTAKNREKPQKSSKTVVYDRAKMFKFLPFDFSVFRRMFFSLFSSCTKIGLGGAISEKTQKTPKNTDFANRTKCPPH